jgi:hypothetical protein
VVNRKLYERGFLFYDTHKQTVEVLPAYTLNLSWIRQGEIFSTFHEIEIKREKKTGAEFMKIAPILVLYVL